MAELEDFHYSLNFRISKSQIGDMGDNSDEEMFEDGEEAEANRAVVTAG